MGTSAFDHNAFTCLGQRGLESSVPRSGSLRKARALKGQSQFTKTSPGHVRKRNVSLSHPLTMKVLGSLLALVATVAVFAPAAALYSKSDDVIQITSDRQFEKDVLKSDGVWCVGCATLCPASL